MSLWDWERSLNLEDKISRLKLKIKSNLDPLFVGIDSYLITDLPYYSNIGDTLIWQGELEYLKSLNLNCLGSSSLQTFDFPSVPCSTAILLQGGGNFGDLWRSSQLFRLKVISHYRDNKIILFPQSIYYSKIDLAISDSKIFSKHNNLYLCVRDSASFHFLRKFFPNNKILLVPDMAFYLSEQWLKPYRKLTDSKILYLKRKDKELISHNYQIYFDEVSDWPTLERHYTETITMSLALRIHKYNFCSNQITKYLCDTYAYRVYRPFLLNLGVNFLSSYSEIVTTRLHAMILALLLHKKVYFIDNLSNKLSSFYKTWLSDLTDIKDISSH